MTKCERCDAELLLVPSAKHPERKMRLDLRPGKGIVLERTAAMGPELHVVHARVVDVYTDHRATCPKGTP